MTKFFKFIWERISWLFSNDSWPELTATKKTSAEHDAAYRKGLTGSAVGMTGPEALGRGPEGVTGIQGTIGMASIPPVTAYPGTSVFQGIRISEAAFNAGQSMAQSASLPGDRPDPSWLKIQITDLTNLPWNKNGQRWKKDVNYKKDIDTIIVHQSASGSKDDLDGINLYQITGPNHLGPEGAPHICYDYGIRKNGEICQLNAPEDVLWSNVGGNIKGIAIVVVGNFTAHDHEGKLLYQGTDEPTPEQTKSLNRLLYWLCHESEFHSNLSAFRVYGHTDFGKPTCPGDVLNALVTDIRRGGYIS